MIEGEFNNPTGAPMRLSPSIAFKVISESLLHGWTYHRLGGGVSKPPTDASDRGSILHRLVLGDGKAFEVNYDFADFRTKAAREWRDEVRRQGSIPILGGDKWDGMRFAADKIREGIARHRIDLDSGSVEERLEWDDMSVPCSGHPDWISEDRTLVLDLKTRDGSVAPRICEQLMNRTEAYLQAEAYKRGVASKDPDLLGRVRVLFAYAEVNPPYQVQMMGVSGSLAERGRRQWERALELWAGALDSGRWPGFEHVCLAEAPAWALALEEEDL